jgi:hypothetical protein
MCNFFCFCLKPNQAAVGVRNEGPKGKKEESSGYNIFCISISIWLIPFYLPFNIEVAMSLVVASAYGLCFLIVCADYHAQLIAKPADRARRVIIILGCLQVIVTMLFLQYKVYFDWE